MTKTRRSSKARAKASYLHKLSVDRVVEYASKLIGGRSIAYLIVWRGDYEPEQDIILIVALLQHHVVVLLRSRDILPRNSVHPMDDLQHGSAAFISRYGI